MEPVDRSAAQGQLGPPPVYNGKTNMEYAAPGTTEWARKAWAEIERLRAQPRLVPHTDEADVAPRGNDGLG